MTTTEVDDRGGGGRTDQGGRPGQGSRTDRPSEAQDQATRRGSLFWVWHVLRQNPLTALGAAMVLGLVLAALLAPWLAPFPGDGGVDVHPKSQLLAPSLEHPFGTDELGRDLFSRVVYGARISLFTGSLVIGLALLIGIPLGAAAGYLGGFVDEVIMRFVDIVLSFPPLLLATALAAMLGSSLVNAMIAVAVAWWPWYARIMRGQAVALRERGYVEAARAGGVGTLRILTRHIIANSLPPLIVQASMDFGSVILTSASLSFLGLGAQPPQPEWGLLISTGRTFFLTNWWYVTFPGLAILVTAVAFNLVGDGLREYLDPRLRSV